VGGIALAVYLYVHAPHLPARVAQRFCALHAFLRNRWYIDALYDAVFVRGIVGLSAWLWRILDTKIIDGGGVHGLTGMTTRLGAWVVLMQTGYLQHYAAWICVGLLVLCGFFVGEVRWLLN
jgi:NADH-quinone oxidoreductase subunit L